MPRMHPIPAIFAAVVFAGLITLAAPAHAIFIQTPLVMEPDQPECDVGDALVFTVGPSPDNASAVDRWAGKTVQIGYSYDENEGTGGPDDPVSDASHVEAAIGSLALDSQARGTFTWTVPAAVDDKNVNVFLEEGGERLAFASISVGNATPMLHAMSGPADGPAEDDAGQEAPEARGAPGIGLAVLLASLGAVVAARRR